MLPKRTGSVEYVAFAGMACDMVRCQALVPSLRLLLGELLESIHFLVVIAALVAYTRTSFLDVEYWDDQMSSDGNS